QLRACRGIIRHMAEAHRRVCRVIRQTGSDLGKVEVGFSKNWTIFQPYNRRLPWDRLIAFFAHAQFNNFVLKHFLDAPCEHTFLGVNYYGRVRFKNGRALVPANGFSREALAAMGVTCDDMLERHPAGLESVLYELHQRFHLPIYLTEHGSA